MRTISSIIPALAMVVTATVLFGCETTPASLNNVDATTPEPVVTVEVVEVETTAATVEVGYEVGMRAPEFAMSLLNGTEVTASGLSADGMPVFLYFHATY